MQAEFNKNLVKNLPDAYRKTPDSNNFKILEVERIACNDLRETLHSINDILDINNARGKTLDLYGARVGQPRGLANDAKYLLMIKAKIMRNLSYGTYASVVNALGATFDCDPSLIIIEDGEEPFTARIVAIPLGAIIQAGLTTTQAYAIVKSLLPIGIKLTSFVFEGTFEFGAGEDDFDDAKGFANNEGTIGGYFGTTFTNDSDEILPI